MKLQNDTEWCWKHFTSIIAQESSANILLRTKKNKHFWLKNAYSIFLPRAVQMYTNSSNLAGLYFLHLRTFRNKTSQLYSFEWALSSRGAGYRYSSLYRLKVTPQLGLVKQVPRTHSILVFKFDFVVWSKMTYVIRRPLVCK